MAETTKKIIISNPPQKRQVTNSGKWVFDSTELTLEKQVDLIKRLQSTSDVINPKTKQMIQKEINNKIGGYKAQDIKKTLYSVESFIDYDYVIGLLIDSQNTCFYCKDLVHVLYENSREPKQWTVERIDNSFGHNKKNVVIACLDCNLRRGTMYHERFAFTKQLNVQKL